MVHGAIDPKSFAVDTEPLVLRLIFSTRAASRIPAVRP